MNTHNNKKYAEIHSEIKICQNNNNKYMSNNNCMKK